MLRPTLRIPLHPLSPPPFYVQWKTERTQVLKKHGVLHIPYRGTMLGAALGGGREILRNPLQPGETMDERLQKKVRSKSISSFLRPCHSWPPQGLFVGGQSCLPGCS